MKVKFSTKNGKENNSNNLKISLKTTLLWWVGTILFFLLVVFSVSFYIVTKQSFYNRVKHSLSVVSNRIKDDYYIVSNKLVTIPQKLDYPINPVMVQVFTIDNHMIAKTQVVIDGIDFSAYLKSQKNFFILNSKQYGKIAVFISKIISPLKGYIIVATPLYKVDLKLKDILIKLLILNPIFLVILLFGVNWILNRILNPINDITKTANQISIGKLNKEIPLPEQQDEIYELVKSFNRMIVRLKDGIEMIEKFNSDVSHELKTPLTVLKGELEIALRKERDVNYYKNILGIALKEVNYLIELVEEILLFTKIENERKLEEVQVDDILLNVMAKLSKKGKEKNITLKLIQLDDIKIVSNYILLKVIFTNLIDNAIKYTPEGKKVYISLYKNRGEMIFVVKDEGIGIDKEEISKIMERFYRTEQSRNRGTKGFGLGLSIVRQALKILNGKIEFYSDKIGTMVKVKIKILENC